MVFGNKRGTTTEKIKTKAGLGRSEQRWGNVEGAQAKTTAGADRSRMKVGKVKGEATAENGKVCKRERTRLSRVTRRRERHGYGRLSEEEEKREKNENNRARV